MKNTSGKLVVENNKDKSFCSNFTKTPPNNLSNYIIKKFFLQYKKIVFVSCKNSTFLIYCEIKDAILDINCLILFININFIFFNKIYNIKNNINYIFMVKTYRCN